MYTGSPHISRIRLSTYDPKTTSANNPNTYFLFSPQRKAGLTLGTLLPGDDVYNLEALLEQDALGDGILDGELDPDAAGMGLGPDEARVDDADLMEAPQLLEAQGEQFAGFGLGADPGRGREQPAVAISAYSDAITID